MRWLELVWATPLLIGLGCGGNVSFSSNGGSAGSTSTGGSMSGIGGAGGSTTSTTNTMTTSGTTTMTTTTTAAATCADACPKVEGCGLPANQCGQYIDCNTMQGQCLAKCVNDPTVMCSDIIDAFQTQSGAFYDCAQACQGGMGGAGGAGGGPSQACQQCGQNNCQNAALQCAQQAGFAECQAWLTCVNSCGDSACADACTAAHPAAAPIAQCVCTTCSADCGSLCSGAGGAGGGTGGAGGSTNTGSGDAQQCQQCGQSQCGTEVQQCFGAGFQQCQAWINCTQQCQDKACIDACTAQNPAGASLGTCICTKCSPGGCAYTCD